MKRHLSHKPLRLILLAAAVLLFCLGMAVNRLHAGGEPLTERTEAHFIDVGQGDATLLLSGGQAVLIDGGEASAGDTVVDYLNALGVTRLLAVVATHPHSDHIGGLPSVVEAFPIDNFYMGADTANTKTYGKLLDALDERGIRPVVPEDGQTLSFSSGAVLTIFCPPDDIGKSNLNDRSLVCQFRAGQQSVLVMGDAEMPSEKALLRRHPQLTCDVLRLGHHGSDTSSSEQLLRAVKPQTAIISCAAQNDYGHPSPDTLQTLSRLSVRDVRITAEQGSIVIALHELSTDKENAA